MIVDGAFPAEAVRQAVRLAETGMIVTFGIAPDCPETGYGYIQRGDALPGEAAAAFRLRASSRSPIARRPSAIAPGCRGSSGTAACSS